MTARLTETVEDSLERLIEEEKRCVGEKATRHALRSLASNADILAKMILKAWKWLQETLEAEGFEGRQLADRCRVLVEAMDWILLAHERFLAQAKAAGLTAEDAGLQDPEAKLPALREALPKVAALLGLASRSPHPVEEARLVESKNAVARGAFINIDDEFLARLRAGEQL